MEGSSELVPFPLLLTPIESNYRACTIPYRFPSDNPRKATPTEISWIDLFLNSVPSFRKRAESDGTIADANVKAENFAQRYSEILEDLKKDPESHGGPPDCIGMKLLDLKRILWVSFSAGFASKFLENWDSEIYSRKLRTTTVWGHQKYSTANGELVHPRTEGIHSNASTSSEDIHSERGFATFAGLGPQTTITFILVEKLRELFCLISDQKEYCYPL